MDYIGNIYHLVLLIQFMLQILISKLGDVENSLIVNINWFIEIHTIKPELVFMP